MCRVCSRHSDKTETISSLYPSTIRRKSKARFWWEKISTAFEVFHEKLYTVKTSVDAIWRSREHCCFSVREGTRRRGSIKAITTFRSKCSAMPGTKKNKKCGNSRLKDPVSGGKKRMGTETYPLVAYNNSKKQPFMMTFNVTFIHINLLTQFTLLK